MKTGDKRPAIPPEKTSEMLQKIMKLHTVRYIPAGILLFRLRRRSFGGLLLLLALLSLIPGVSIITGLIIMILGLQLCLGFRSPRLPHIWNDYRIDVPVIQKFVGILLPWTETLEKMIRPRMHWLTQFPFTALPGMLIMILAVIVMLPLPFTGLLPVIALLFMALGLLERDGIMICIAYLISILAIATGYLIVMAIVQTIA